MQLKEGIFWELNSESAKFIFGFTYAFPPIEETFKRQALEELYWAFFEQLKKIKQKRGNTIRLTLFPGQLDGLHFIWGFYSLPKGAIETLIGTLVDCLDLAEQHSTRVILVLWKYSDFGEAFYLNSQRMDTFKEDARTSIYFIVFFLF